MIVEGFMREEGLIKKGPEVYLKLLTLKTETEHKI